MNIMETTLEIKATRDGMVRLSINNARERHLGAIEYDADGQCVATNPHGDHRVYGSAREAMLRLAWEHIQ